MSKYRRLPKCLKIQNISCLVEDEAALREVVAERLAERGYDVVQASNGEEALERLAEFAFDIVVTDLRLPGIDGDTRCSRRPSRATRTSSPSSSPATGP